MKRTNKVSCLSARMFAALIAGIILLGALPALAQTPFVMENFGQKIDSDDARMIGRGGWGMAVVDSMHPGFKNIAGLTNLRYITLKYTGYGEQAQNKNSDSERTTHRTLSPDIRVGIPIIKGKLAFTAGFNIGRSMQYNARSDTTWFVGGDASADSIIAERNFQREGTLLTVPLGLAYEVVDGVSLAATVGLANGTIRETLYNYYSGPATFDGVPLYSPNKRIQEDKFSGTNNTFSFLFSRWEWLKFGGSYTSEYTLDVDRKTVLGGVAGSVVSNYQMVVPAEYRAGFDTRLSSRWHFGADAQYQDFKEFTGRADWEGALESEYTLGLGFERFRSKARHGGMGNLPLRFGAQYRQWGYWIGENPVEEMTFSVGTGFPFNHDLGQLDVAFSYSRVGELAKNGLESNVYRFTLSMTGLERWW